MFKKCLMLNFVAIASLIAMPQTIPPEFSLDQNYPQHLIINNRVLLKIGDQVITVMDVVRKMDLLFYKQYPELASSSMARYQFYLGAWRTLLNAVIDDHLIVSDAKEKEVSVTDGEVREELETIFGPDVVLNIDQMGMTLQEAFELLKRELIVQKMTAIMVRSRAMTDVHPQSVRSRYQKFLKDHPTKNYWVYRILSIRGEEHEKMAQEAFRLIQEEHIPFVELANHLDGGRIEISCSDEYRQEESEISTAYRSVLETLSIDQVSPPISAKNVSRLFCLKGLEKEEAPSFRTSEEELMKELTQEAFAKHNLEYRRKLRQHYCVTDKYLRRVVPDSLQPFALR